MRLVSSPVAAGSPRHRAQIASIAALAVLLSAAFSHPAAGAAITFTPSGAPFDNDAPPNILTSPGAQVTFHAAFDTASLSGPIGSVSYSIFNAGDGTTIGVEEVPSPQIVSVQPIPVSEPSSLLLLGAGIAILTRLGRRAFSAHR